MDWARRVKDSGTRVSSFLYRRVSLKILYQKISKRISIVTSYSKRNVLVEPFFNFSFVAKHQQRQYGTFTA